MSWSDAVEALRIRRHRALDMGGAEKVARQRAAGKMTARERIAGLLDRDTFEEFGALTTMQPSRAEPDPPFTAADAFITGIGRINGRLVALGVEDFTVMGGAWGKVAQRKRRHLAALAIDERIPLVLILEGGGARLQESAGGSFPRGDQWNEYARVSGQVPFVAAVMGSAAAAPALLVPLADFSVMVRGTGMAAVGGPPLVERSLGIEIDKESLGGASVHVDLSGVVHQAVDSDRECLDLIRTYLGYFPSSAWDLPPRADASDDPGRRDERLLSVVPTNPRRAYDMHAVLDCVVDTGSWLEIQPTYGRSVIAGLARIDGQPVGILANNPKVLAGAIDGPAADKHFHFVQVCNAFHLPVAFFMDVPGFMVGPDAERSAVLRRGMRAQHVVAHATVPTICFVLRKAYGMGAIAMGGAGGTNPVYAWPSVEFGSLPVQGGAAAAYKAELADSEDSESLLAEREAALAALSSWETAAAVFDVDDVVDPRDTRPLIVQFLERVHHRLEAQRGVATRYGITP